MGKCSRSVVSSLSKVLKSGDHISIFVCYLCHFCCLSPDQLVTFLVCHLPCLLYMLSVVLVLCHLCLSSVFVIFVCSVQSLSALIFSRFRRALLAAYYYSLLASSLSSIFACSLASLSSLLFLFVIFVLRSLSSFVIFVCYLRLLSSFVIFVPCLRSLLSFDIFFCYLRSLLSFVIFARYLRLLPSFVILVIFHSTRSSSSSFVACLVRHLSRLSFCSVLCVS